MRDIHLHPAAKKPRCSPLLKKGGWKIVERQIGDNIFPKRREPGVQEGLHDPMGQEIVLESKRDARHVVGDLVIDLGCEVIGIADLFYYLRIPQTEVKRD